MNARATQADPGDIQISGTWLVVARSAWLFLFVTNLWYSVVAITLLHHQTLHPCVNPTCPVTPAQAATLRGIGVNVGDYANLITGVAIALTAIGALMALAIFWRRSNTRIALVVGVFLFTFSVGNLTSGVSVTLISPLVDNAISLASLGIAFSVFMIFPDGRFVPRWTWVLVVAWVAFHGALGAYPEASWLDAFYPVIYLSALGVQVYRYRRVSNARRRQQTKLVVFGFIVALLSNIIYWIALPGIFPTLNAPGSLYSLIGYPVYLIVTLILPTSFAIAIQRFQLFDVDVLINRALVYGSLTAILGALYFGLIAGAQALLRAFTGQQDQSQLVIVLSTLLTAALVQPLRRSIQTAIDRRFYRRKYDAARTLAEFGATLRSEIELSDLSDHLISVVQETMQPEKVSLWLRPQEHPDERAARADAEPGGA
jgi:hypothetical protein